jgi:hypothetical protein
MNAQDEFTIFILQVIDLFLDLISFGAWSRWQGAREIGFKAKEK